MLTNERMARRNSAVLNKMEASKNVLSSEKVKQIVEEQIDGSFGDVVTLKKDKNRVIDLSNPSNIVRTLSRIGYVAGSLVGIITNLVEVSAVLMSNKYNKQFLCKNAQGQHTTRVNMFLLSKVFTCLGTGNGSEEGYEEIFVNSDMKDVENKIFRAIYIDGRTMELVKATKQDISRFVEQLSNAAVLYQEDLVKIGRDLEKIGRLMQELEIDSAKKPDIKENMKEITEFMNGFGCKLASKKVRLVNNFEDIVFAFKFGKNAKEMKFEYGFEDYISLEEVPALVAKEHAIIDANTDLTDEEKARKKWRVQKEILNNSVIIDPAFDLKKEMVAQTKADVEVLSNCYVNSDMDLFKRYTYEVAEVKDKEAASKEVLRFAILATDMMNSHFAYKGFVTMTKLDEVAKTLRNAIYSLGEKHGLTADQTFRIAVSAGWKRIYGNKVEGCNFKYRAIESLFATELKWDINPQQMASSVELELPEGYGIVIDRALKFVDGVCEVELDNGETGFITCASEEDYTGLVIAEVVNGVPVFNKYEDRYLFERIEFMSFDKIADLYAAENTFKSKEQVIPACTTTVVEPSTKGLSESDKEKAKTAFSNKFQGIVKGFTNFMQKAMSEPEFSLATFKINETGNKDNPLFRTYLTIKRVGTENGKALGRLGSLVKKEEFAKYQSIDTIICPAGALVILNK
jgi:hypothetical protein